MTLTTEQRAAYHEAGHVVAYTIFGWTVKSANIKQFTREDGCGTVAGQTFIDDSKDVECDEVTCVQQYMIATLAGPLAGQFAAGEQPGSITVDFREDAESLVQAAARLTNSKADAKALIASCVPDAKHLVANYWNAIDAVAKRLLADTEVAGDVLLAICREQLKR